MYLASSARRPLKRDNTPYNDFRLALHYSARPDESGPVPVVAQTVGHTLNVTLPGLPLDRSRAAAAGWRDPLTFTHGGRPSWYVGGLLSRNVGHVVDSPAGASAHRDSYGPLTPLHALLDWIPSYYYRGPARPYWCSRAGGCFRGLGAFAPAPGNIQSVLQNASASSGVPYSILQALAYQESSYRPDAVSPAGAQGLLQLMPATGASLGVSDPFNPQQNATAGANYLMSLYRQYGNWSDALIAYNEGPGALAAKGAYPASQQYAAQILANAGVPDSSFPGSAAAAAGSGASTDGVPTYDASSFTDLLPNVDFSDPLVLAGLAVLAGAALYLAS